MTLLAALVYENFEQLGEDSNPRGLCLSADEASMLMSGITNDRVYPYALSTPGDVTTSTYAGSGFSTTTQGVNPNSVRLNAAGSTMLVGLDPTTSANDGIYQYTLSTPNDPLSASYASKRLLTGGPPFALEVKPDLSKVYVGVPNVSIDQYDLGTPGDVTTGSLVDSLNINADDTNIVGIAIDSTGLILLYLGSSTNTIYERHLSAPWDLSTAGAVVDSLAVGSLDTTTTDLFLGSSRLYMIGQTNDRVHQWKRPTTGRGWVVGSVTLN